MIISDKRIVTICADIASAIDQKGLSRLDPLLPITCFAGRLARFLNAVRTDAKSKTLSTRLIERFASRTGLSLGGIEDIRDFLTKLKVGYVTQEGKFRTEIEDIEEVYSICAAYWKRKLRGKEESEDYFVVTVLDTLYLPSSVESVIAILGNRELVTTVIPVLLELGLVFWSKKLGVNFSPKFFGKEEETIGTFIDRTKGASREFVDLVETIQACQGYPDDAVPTDLRSQTDAALATGILEPIGVVLGGKLIRFLFTPEPVEDRIYLSKETTAHFRYNERFADPTKGRLRDPVRFLEVLIESGTAGAADNIATNYLALEEKGVVVARIGGISGRPMMVARKLDVLKDTKSLIESDKPLPRGPSYDSLADWIKNPVETRITSGVPRVIDEKSRVELVRMLRDEVR